MNRPLLSEISHSLNCSGLCKMFDINTAADMVLYSAMSEWIRMITFDVDPILGSSKTGVTRAYLEERAASVLVDLAAALCDTSIEKTRAKELVSWMITQMLFLGELWEPIYNLLNCAQNRIVCEWDGLIRTTGVRTDFGVSAIQIGLCHYHTPTREMLATAEERRKEINCIAKAFPLFPVIPGKTDKARAILTNLQVQSLEAGTTYDVKRKILPEDTWFFLLSCGWPKSTKPFHWDKAEAWLIPNSSILQ